MQLCKKPMYRRVVERPGIKVYRQAAVLTGKPTDIHRTGRHCTWKKSVQAGSSTVLTGKPTDVHRTGRHCTISQPYRKQPEAVVLIEEVQPFTLATTQFTVHIKKNIQAD
jgi:hypothetical protein